MSEDVEARGLARIRRRRAAFALSLALLAASAIARHAFPSPDWTALLLAACALYAATTLLCVFSRCPRCRHLFHGVRGMDNPLSRSCRGCGLRLRPRNA